MADPPVKTRSQSTQGLAAIKASLVKTRLESRRSRTQDGTPISYSAIKGNIDTTKTRNLRESRSFSDPDISGSLVIFSEANGLFKKALNASSFKGDPLPSVYPQIPTERPLFITEKDKASVKKLSSSLEEVSSDFGSSKLHMAEFANPLHRGNQPRFRKGGGVMAAKPTIPPKPVKPPKPPLKSQPVNISYSGQNKVDDDSRSPSKSLESELKGNVKNTRAQFEAKMQSSSSPSKPDSIKNMDSNASQDNEAVCVKTNSLLCSTNTAINNTNTNNGIVSTSLESDLSGTSPETESIQNNIIQNIEKSTSAATIIPPSKISSSKLPVLSTTPTRASPLESKNIHKDRKSTATSVFYDDDDDGAYTKVLHAKPSIPSRPPPRKPPTKKIDDKNAINNKEENTIITKAQHEQPEIERENCKTVPLYAKVDKSKKKARSHTFDINSHDENWRTSRSESDPSPYNVNVTTSVQYSTVKDVETMKRDTIGSEIDGLVSDSDSDEGWDPMEFDDDDSSEFENDDEDAGKKSQGEAMQFPDQRSKKLYNIAYEILTTERAYVKRLHLLDKVFYARLQDECLAQGHITADVLPDIFSNISSIHSFHQDFLLPKLEERMGQWGTDSRIGDILKTLAPFLKLYTAYIANFDKSSETLATWTKKSPKFAAIIEEIQKSKECENLTLGHHMLEPIQRVPRYKLLLKDYLSKLPEDSSDYKDTQDALEIISEAATHANDSMKKTERFKKLLELQERVIDDYNLITAGRQFIMEGDLSKVAARHVAHQERTLLLFSDVLLCCAKLPGSNKLKVKVEMDLYGMEIGDSDEDVELTNTFRVTSKQRVMDFSAPNDEEREKWVNKINEAVQEISIKRESYKRGSQTNALSNHELGKKAPAWVRDEAVTMCMSCDCLFTLTRRRHHCRACGGIYCNSCSHFKGLLEYSGKVERICQTCHKIIVRGTKASIVKKTVEEKRHHDVRKISRDSKVIMSGYLSFKSGKGWVKRWCVLSDTFEFYCYKAKKDQKADFSLPLPGYVVDKPNLADNLDKKIAFKLHHRNVVIYYFAADNQETLERWMHNLSYAVKAERVPEEDSETIDLPVSDI